MAASPVLDSSSERFKLQREFDNSKVGVKGLVDSGITSIPQIFAQPPETLSDLKCTSTSKTIPLIDLADYNSPNQRPKITNQIKEAAATWGFFQLINHGVPLAVLDETIAAAKAFHEQPNEVKAKYYKRGDERMRGVAFSSNDALFKASATWHDTLQIWHWPQRVKDEDIPEICRKELVAWEFHATELADVLLGLMSEGLGLEMTKFKDLTFLESKLFLAHYYPPCPQPDLTLGLHAHNDLGTITVLLQNRIPGLQVKHGDEWVEVKPVHGALVINVGDFTQIVSNGEYKSPKHRVLANSFGEPRVTLGAFFGVGDWKDSKMYGPLPELLSPEKPSLYREFTLQEFFEKYKESIGSLDNKPFSDRFRIDSQRFRI